MRRLVRRAVQLAALLVSAATAQAQGRHRVLVGIAGTQRMSLIEFSPCIPAETSACGAWVSRVIDTATDTSYGPLPPAAVEQHAANGASISIQDGGMLNVQSLAQREAASHSGKLMGDPRRTATAVVLSQDSRYAFAVLEAKADADQSMVRMIDIASQSFIASIHLAARPVGIAIAP